ncbi:variant-silencing SET domain-containing protein-like isoform X2 [Centruroides sculpturatus]|uniref:variant-silencing SET domain-containing protein-like isoform X2 n=1 Tax=Centruroides sculpturatus TaxID=218467 RepID=UPI000C6D3448|nr:variant-silencing SET domain-containing protein-like isoform X2 [Centruroides sculpturatus]
MNENCLNIILPDKENDRSNPPGKRRSSILKPVSRAPLQELDCNSNKDKETRRSRRVSFADTCQIKEVVFSHSGITEFNLTREIKDTSETQGHSPDELPISQPSGDGKFVNSKEAKYNVTKNIQNSIEVSKSVIDQQSHSEGIISKDKYNNNCNNVGINLVDEVNISKSYEYDGNQNKTLIYSQQDLSMTCLEDIVETSRESSSIVQEQTKCSNKTIINTIEMDITHIQADVETLPEHFEGFFQNKDYNKQDENGNKTMIFNNESCVNLEETMCGNAVVQARNLDSSVKDEYLNETNGTINATIYSEITCASLAGVPDIQKDDDYSFISRDKDETNLDKFTSDMEYEDDRFGNSINKSQYENRILCEKLKINEFHENHILVKDDVVNTQKMLREDAKLEEKISDNAQTTAIQPTSEAKFLQICKDTIKDRQKTIGISQLDKNTGFNCNSNESKHDKKILDDNFKCNLETDEVQSFENSGISEFHFEIDDKNKMENLIEQNTEQSAINLSLCMSENKTKFSNQELDLKEQKHEKNYKENNLQDKNIDNLTNITSCKDINKSHKEIIDLQNDDNCGSNVKIDIINANENLDERMSNNDHSTPIEGVFGNIPYPSDFNRKSLVEIHQKKIDTEELPQRSVKSIFDKEYPSNFKWKSLTAIQQETNEINEFCPKLIPNVCSDESTNDGCVIEETCQSIKFPTCFKWRSLLAVNEEKLNELPINSSKNNGLPLINNTVNKVDKNDSCNFSSKNITKNSIEVSKCKSDDKRFKEKTDVLHSFQLEREVQKDCANSSKLMFENDKFNYLSRISDTNVKKPLDKTEINIDETMNFTKKLPDVYFECCELPNDDQSKVMPEQFYKTLNVTKIFDDDDLSLTRPIPDFLKNSSPKTMVIDETTIMQESDMKINKSSQKSLNRTKFIDDDMNLTNIKSFKLLDGNVLPTEKYEINTTISADVLSNSNVIKNLSGNMNNKNTRENIENFIDHSNDDDNSLTDSDALQNNEYINQQLQEKVNKLNYKKSLTQTLNSKSEENKSMLLCEEVYDKIQSNLQLMSKENTIDFVCDKKLIDSESYPKNNNNENNSKYDSYRSLNKSNAFYEESNIAEKENLSYIKRKRIHDEIKLDAYSNLKLSNKKPKLADSAVSCTWKISAIKKADNESLKVNESKHLSDINHFHSSETTELPNPKSKIPENEHSNISSNAEMMDTNTNCKNNESIESYNELSQPIGFFKAFEKDSDSSQDTVTQPYSLLNMVPIKPVKKINQNISEMDDDYLHKKNSVSRTRCDENNLYSSNTVLPEKQNVEFCKKTKLLNNFEKTYESEENQNYVTKNESHLHISERILSSSSNFKAVNQSAALSELSKEQQISCSEIDDIEISPVKFDLQKSPNISTNNDRDTFNVTDFIKQNTCNLFIPMSSTQIINFDNNITFNKSEVESILPLEETRMSECLQLGEMDYCNAVASPKQSTRNNNDKVKEIDTPEKKIENIQRSKVLGINETFVKVPMGKITTTNSIQLELDNDLTRTKNIYKPDKIIENVRESNAEESNKTFDKLAIEKLDINTANKNEEAMNKSKKDISSNSKMSNRIEDKISLRQKGDESELHLNQSTVSQVEVKNNHIIEDSLQANRVNETRREISKRTFINCDAVFEQNDVTTNKKIRLTESVCSTTAIIGNSIVDNCNKEITKSEEAVVLPRKSDFDKVEREEKEIKNETLLMNKMEQCIFCNPSISKTFLGNLTKNCLNENGDQLEHDSSCCNKRSEDECVQLLQEDSVTEIENEDDNLNGSHTNSSGEREPLPASPIPSPPPLPPPPAKMSTIRKLRDEINSFYRYITLDISLVFIIVFLDS